MFDSQPHTFATLNRPHSVVLIVDIGFAACFQHVLLAWDHLPIGGIQSYPRICGLHVQKSLLVSVLSVYETDTVYKRPPSIMIFLPIVNMSSSLLLLVFVVLIVVYFFRQGFFV